MSHTGRYVYVKKVSCIIWMGPYTSAQLLHETKLWEKWKQNETKYLQKIFYNFWEGGKNDFCSDPIFPLILRNQFLLSFLRCPLLSHRLSGFLQFVNTSKTIEFRRTFDTWSRKVSFQNVSCFLLSQRFSDWLSSSSSVNFRSN